MYLICSNFVLASRVFPRETQLAPTRKKLQGIEHQFWACRLDACRTARPERAMIMRPRVTIRVVVERNRPRLATSLLTSSTQTDLVKKWQIMCYIIRGQQALSAWALEQPPTDRFGHGKAQPHGDVPAADGWKDRLRRFTPTIRGPAGRDDQTGEFEQGNNRKLRKNEKRAA